VFQLIMSMTGDLGRFVRQRMYSNPRFIQMASPCILLVVAAIIFKAQHHPFTASIDDRSHKVTSCWNDADPIIKGVDLGATSVESKELHFFVVADWGVVSSGLDIKRSDPSIPIQLASAMNDEMRRRRIRFVVTVGDHFYPHGVNSTDDARWRSTFEDVFSLHRMAHLRWYGVMGNHDYSGNALRGDDSFSVAQIERTNHQQQGTWCLPSYFYSFSYVLQDFAVTFIGIDTVILTLCSIPNHKFCGGRSLSSPDGTPLTRTMMLWLERRLEASASSGDFIVVFGHNPLVGIGSHIDTTCESRGGDAANIDALGALLSRYNVSLYLTGHEHLSEMFTGHHHDGHSRILSVCAG